MIELEMLEKRQTFRLLDFYRKTFVESMHDLAGFPQRSSRDLNSMTWLFMPRALPEKEIIETTGYSKMLRAILRGSQLKAMPSYSRMFTMPLNTRLGIPKTFPDPEKPKSPDFPEGLLDGFRFILDMSFLERHALPIAFLWANSELCQAGFKPFTAPGEGAVKMRELASRGEYEKALFETMEDCRQAEREPEKPGSPDSGDNDLAPIF